MKPSGIKIDPLRLRKTFQGGSNNFFALERSYNGEKKIWKSPRNCTECNQMFSQLYPRKDITSLE